MTTVIDLTKTHDYQGNTILASTLLQHIAYLRQDVSKNQRDPNKFVEYKIIFFPNTSIFGAGNDKTNQGDIYIVKIDSKSFYPQFVNGKCRIVQIRNKKQTNIDFQPTYSGKYCVVEAIGVLVAESMRFNTIERTTVQEKETKHYYNSSEFLFNDLWKNYENVFKNWKTASLGEYKLPPGINVVMKWLP